MSTDIHKNESSIFTSPELNSNHKNQRENICLTVQRFETQYCQETSPMVKGSAVFLHTKFVYLRHMLALVYKMCSTIL